MAKHRVGKTVSAGKRASCNKLRAAAPKPQVGNNNNAIREAFMVAPLSDSVRFSRMGSAIIKAAQAPVKQTAEAIKGWSTKLSFRTFNALKAQGILS